MKAILTRVRISPKKANLVAGMIRGVEAEEALSLLKFTNKKASDILYKLLFSAVSNATNNFSKKTSDLVVSKISVTEGPTFKRGQSRSKGRVFSLLKRTANINIELSEKDGVEVESDSVTTEEVTSTK